MCTCLDFKTKGRYFGRNLDLEYRFGERVAITPRGYAFALKNGETLRTQYAMVGMATVVGGYPLYAEAGNEKGLCMAGLYFPQNARFFAPQGGALNLAPYELIPYFLGRYETVAQLRPALEKLNITDAAFAPELPLTDLHWMISDGEECVVLEQTCEGLRVYDDPVGVLTNNPPFPYHLANLANYGNLTAHRTESRFAAKLPLEQYGQGMGAIGLPGDASPASRFVRAAFNKWNSDCGQDEESSVTQFFHILDSVAMVQGATVTAEGKNDVTTYSCCYSAEARTFYYKTYANNRITAVRMTEAEMEKQALTVFELEEKQQFRYEN